MRIQRVRLMNYVGYPKLQPGKIHLICPRCGRKQSNAVRGPYDPPKAVMCSTLCERCGHGGKGGDEAFRDAAGRELCNMCGRYSCEYAEGARECDERLAVEPRAEALGRKG